MTLWRAIRRPWPAPLTATVRPGAVNHTTTITLEDLRRFEEQLRLEAWRAPIRTAVWLDEFHEQPRDLIRSTWPRY